MTRLPKLIFIGTAVTVLFLTGCTPVGPLPPMLGADGMGMLLLVLVTAIGYFIWQRLAAISSRLEALEKEIEKLKNKTKGKDHD